MTVQHRPDSNRDSQKSTRTERAGSTKTKAARGWLAKQSQDPVEHAILGSFDLGYAMRHPIKSSAWAFGFSMSLLMIISFILGAFHLAFGKPGSVAFDWQRPTTWVASGVDAVREPVANGFGIASDRVRGVEREQEDGSGYDPNSFDE